MLTVSRGFGGKERGSACSTICVQVAEVGCSVVCSLRSAVWSWASWGEGGDESQRVSARTFRERGGWRAELDVGVITMRSRCMSRVRAPTQAPFPKGMTPRRSAAPPPSSPSSPGTHGLRLLVSSLARPSDRSPPAAHHRQTRPRAPPRHSVHADRPGVLFSREGDHGAAPLRPFPRSSSGSLPLSTYVLTKGG